MALNQLPQVSKTWMSLPWAEKLINEILGIGEHMVGGGWGASWITGLSQSLKSCNLVSWPFMGNWEEWKVKRIQNCFYLSNGILKTGSEWPIHSSLPGWLSGQGIEIRSRFPPYSSGGLYSFLLPNPFPSPTITSYLLFKQKSILLIYEYIQ